MKSESLLVVDLWEQVRDHIPASSRLDTAIQILKTFEDYGFEREDMADIVDEDRYLARAFDDIFGGDEAEEEEEE